MLPCGHTFCRTCLASVEEERKGLTCPTCRSTHLALSSHHLPVNYTVLDLSHQSSEVQAEEQRGLCSSHGEPLCYWCRECAVLVCGHCLLEQHLKQGHDVLHAAEFVAERKQAIEARVQHLQAVFRDSRARTRTCLHRCLLHFVWLCHESKNIFDLDDELFHISSEAKSLRDVEAVLVSETRLRSLHRRGTAPAQWLDTRRLKRLLVRGTGAAPGGGGAAGGAVGGGGDAVRGGGAAGDAVGAGGDAVRGGGAAGDAVGAGGDAVRGGGAAGDAVGAGGDAVRGGGAAGDAVGAGGDAVRGGGAAVDPVGGDGAAVDPVGGGAAGGDSVGGGGGTGANAVGGVGAGGDTEGAGSAAGDAVGGGGGGGDTVGGAAAGGDAVGGGGTAGDAVGAGGAGGDTEGAGSAAGDAVGGGDGAAGDSVGGSGVAGDALGGGGAAGDTEGDGGAAGDSVHGGGGADGDSVDGAGAAGDAVSGSGGGAAGDSVGDGGAGSDSVGDGGGADGDSAGGGGAAGDRLSGDPAGNNSVGGDTKGRRRSVGGDSLDGDTVVDDTVKGDSVRGGIGDSEDGVGGGGDGVSKGGGEDVTAGVGGGGAVGGGGDDGGGAAWWWWPLTCRAVSSDGRQAELRREENCLLVGPLAHCLTEPHLTIQMSLLESVVGATNPLVYLELSAGHRCLGRVTVRLWGHLRRAQHFRALCLATFGPSFLGSKFEYVGNRGRPGEYIVGGSYLTHHHCATTDGGGTWLQTRTTRGLMEGLEWGGKFVGADREGVLQGAGGGHPEYDSLFCICSRSDPTGESQCPFGEVVSGMAVVRAAVQQEPVSDLTITGCGLLIPDV